MKLNDLKKIAFLGLFLFLFSACEMDSKFTGYIVGKEYRPEHMSNETVQPVNYSTFIPPRVVVHNPPKPHLVKASYVWFVANKHQVIELEVSVSTFHSKKCGEKVCVTRW